MTDDTAQMATAYLDLWQQQMQQMMQDPKQMEMWQQLAAQNMQQYMAGFANPMPGFAATPCNNDGKQTSTAGAAPAAAASDSGAHDLAELGRRLAAVEARLADLEARFFNTSG